MWGTVVAITARTEPPMPEPTTSRYPDAWHNAEDAQERAWLDDWIRGLVCPITLAVCPAAEPAATVPSLATAGSH